ncbi:MAG: hypothetical protein J6O71_03675 [Lachnospiraceae bacterium]|nr:hypothetical protein [Lachnospiraceae bacterium]
MAWSDIGDFFKQNLGITEKAILEIIDLRDRQVEQNDAVRVVMGSAGDNLLVDGGNGNNKQTHMSAGIVQDELENQADQALGGKGKIQDRKNRSHQVNRYLNAKAKYFTVQFNPNSLRLSGHSGGLVRKTAYNAAERRHGTGGKLDYGPGKTYIELGVSLLFDKVDPQDAFLGDKLAPSLTNMGKGIAKAGMKLAGKKKNTVQPEVEALIAALRNENTRLITFHWGQISYPGVLKSVTANYVMFNVSGEPIRATVDLSMTCADDEIMPRSLDMWQNLYREAFRDEAEAGGKSYVKTSQKVGGLLNI